MKNAFGVLASLLLLAGCGSSDDRDIKKMTTSPQNVPGRYKLDAGDYPVGAIPSVTLHDARRNKDLDVVIEYPSKGEGPFPVIVFSHGYGGTNKGYVGLTEYWAGHGYVCIKPSHADAGRLREILHRQRNQAIADAPHGRRPAAVTVTEAIWESQTVKDWVDRARDVSFILDSLDTIEAQFPELKGKLDRNKIGAGGHSYGAFTALMVAGMHPVREGMVDMTDRRVKAVIAMSPQGVSELRGLGPDAWRDVHVPVMYMTGSEDIAGENEDAVWRRTAFEHTPAGDKYFVLIEGANHMSFAGGFSEPDPTEYTREQLDTMTLRPANTGQGGRTRSEGRFERERSIYATIKIASVAFWDAHLKLSPEAREYLDAKLARSGVEVVKK